MPLRLLALRSKWMHLWLFVFLRNSNLFQSSSSLLGGKVVASQCTASLSWSECSRRGGLMPTKLLCNHSHRVTAWGCGQGSQHGAKHQDRQPRFSWQGGLRAGWGLPSQGRRTIICIWSLVAQWNSVGFLQQIVQGKNRSYLLPLVATYAGMSSP